MYISPDFDPVKEAEHIIAHTRNWFETNGPQTTAVLGISGGKDSTIAAKILVEALGKDRVLGVLMPCNLQPDIMDSIQAADMLDIENICVNIGQTESKLRNTIKKSGFHKNKARMVGLSKDALINMQPRIRMTVLYALAQSEPNGGRVINTCNASEDYVGYSTKYGDAAGDYAPLADYTVSELLAIGDALGLPENLVHKTPSDGLSGMSDEIKLGVSYADIDRYIRTGACDDEMVKNRIDYLHQINMHKLKPIPFCPRLAA